MNLTLVCATHLGLSSKKYEECKFNESSSNHIICGIRRMHSTGQSGRKSYVCLSIMELLRIKVLCSCVECKVEKIKL